VAADDDVADVQDLDGVLGGMMLPMTREMKRSPGSDWKIRLGTTRESAQVMKRMSGFWVSARR
jgi:hypothetical protein